MKTIADLPYLFLEMLVKKTTFLPMNNILNFQNSLKGAPTLLSIKLLCYVTCPPKRTFLEWGSIPREYVLLVLIFDTVF